MTIALIGYRGSGKTSVAQRLAERLGWDWLDADAELESRAGRTIKEIFATDGEATFRDLEQQLTDDLLRRDELVLATGGGVILRQANRRALATVVVVWLRAEPAVLCERISCDPTTGERRPNLTAAGGIDEIVQLLAERSPLYAECADYEVDTGQKSLDQLAEEIVSLVEGPPRPNN
ncbi:MAG: shikimate kinase [Pirellulaceae bacterium]|jgi:shikimate kinase|nr:shikimate kinase [Pirellulaceae bacterium]